MKTIDDVLMIRRRVFGAFEMAETATGQAERQRWLTFAVVGAGPTGVELGGQIRELATMTLHAEFRHIKPEDGRVLLFDGVGAPLAAFGPQGLGRGACSEGCGHGRNGPRARVCGLVGMGGVAGKLIHRQAGRTASGTRCWYP